MPLAKDVGVLPAPSSNLGSSERARLLGLGDLDCTEARERAVEEEDLDQVIGP